MAQSTTELSKYKAAFEVENVRSQEKLSALALELDMVKEQAQRSSAERKSAIDRLARVEVDAQQTNETARNLKSELKTERVGRRLAENRVSELQELVNRLMVTNEELASSSKKSRRRVKKKTTRKASATKTTRTTAGGGGAGAMSRARKKQADADRAAARRSAKNGKSVSLKEQVRRANLGKDPPFMPSGNPKVDNNVYSITQKQLSNPMAYGNSSSSYHHQHHHAVATSSSVSPTIPSSSSSPSSATAPPPPAPSSSTPSSSSSSSVLIPAISPYSSSSVPLSKENPPAPREGGLDAVVDAIRYEVSTLTQRRDTMLQNVAQSPDHLNLDQRTIDTALSDLQKKIESKTRQITLLEKQLEAQRWNAEAISSTMSSSSSSSRRGVVAARTARHSPRSPLRDTEASEKKQAALDLLRHYKTTSAEHEMDHLHELQGRSMAATGGGAIGSDSGDYSTSARRGTYFGTYESDEVETLRGLHRTASSSMER